jgi:hypothetical protein
MCGRRELMLVALPLTGVGPRGSYPHIHRDCSYSDHWASAATYHFASGPRFTHAVQDSTPRLPAAGRTAWPPGQPRYRMGTFVRDLCPERAQDLHLGLRVLGGPGSGQRLQPAGLVDVRRVRATANMGQRACRPPPRTSSCHGLWDAPALLRERVGAVVRPGLGGVGVARDRARA